MKHNYRSVNYKSNGLTLEVKDQELVNRRTSSFLESSYPRHIPQCKPKPHYQNKGIGDWFHPHSPDPVDREKGSRKMPSSHQKWCWLHPSAHNFPSQYAYCSIN